jgi:hypothetical protein
MRPAPPVFEAVRLPGCPPRYSVAAPCSVCGAPVLVNPFWDHVLKRDAEDEARSIAAEWHGPVRCGACAEIRRETVRWRKVRRREAVRP